MDERLKERLTGAVILVAVVVLLVPAMFRGRPPADATATTAMPAVVPPAAAAPAADAEAMPAVQPPAAAPAAAPAPAPAAIAASSASKGWVVQVGSFSVRENAERMVRQGAKAGMKLQVAGPDDKGYYRVRTAVLRERATALKVQARYMELGYKSLINTAP